jgi:DNA polymerase-3 subunit delta
VNPAPPRSLAKAERGGVFYLYGDDEFRKEELARRLIDAHLDPATKDFNLDSRRGSQLEVEELASVLATPPMMAEWRVVVVRETEALAASARARELLMSVLSAPPPGLALILLATVPEGSSARIYKDIEARSRSYHLSAVPLNDLPDWLMNQAREFHGVELEEDAARALGAAVGSDLGVLTQELEKLATLVGERGIVTRQDVEDAGIQLPHVDRWQWIDRVGERRFEEALGALPTLFAQGESGVYLVVGLTTQLLRVGVALHGGRSAVEEAVPPQMRRWLPDKLVRQARKWPAAEIEAAIVDLQRVDRLLKSTSLSQQGLIEAWLLERLAAARAA